MNLSVAFKFVNCKMVVWTCVLVASDIMVEPLCGGMGSEGGGRSSEGGAGWEDRWREAAGRIAVGGGWESALLSFNDFFVFSLDVCS